MWILSWCWNENDEGEGNMSDERRRLDDERWDRILAHMEDQGRFFDEKLKPVNALLFEIKNTVYGNNGNPVGHAIRIDRIEQKEKIRVWYMRSLLAAIIIAAGNSIWGVLKRLVGAN